MKFTATRLVLICKMNFSESQNKYRHRNVKQNVDNYSRLKMTSLYFLTFCIFLFLFSFVELVSQIISVLLKIKRMILLSENKKNKTDNSEITFGWAALDVNQLF